MTVALANLSKMQEVAQEKGRKVFSYRNIALRAIQDEKA